jgi:2-polyprenyl-3-methyl-5-hydroxy-6-metoxy-1,4-benzoquinol methylase
MTSFRHGDNRIKLQPGESWSSHSGRETYHDTSAAELRQITAEVEAGEPWRDCVTRHYAKSNPWLCRIVTDPARSLFFQLHPLPLGQAVLDVGAGWGQLSLPLARDHPVTAVEPTAERIDFMRAAAKQEGVTNAMTYVQSDLLDLEFETRYDCVLCIGVLEWVPKFRPGEPREVQLSFLSRIRSLLKPGGRLVLGTENRLGLKYLLGSSDDHIGLPGIAVLDSELARQRYLSVTGKELRCFTYSLAEYLDLFSAAGFKHVIPYAALPDYKLPAVIRRADAGFESAVADGRIVLPAEHDGCNGEQLRAPFQETLQSHYHSLAANGLSRFFAPSYFFTAS